MPKWSLDIPRKNRKNEGVKREVYLDGKGRACQKNEAMLQESIQDPELRSFKTYQKIQAYNPKIGKAAGTEAEKRPTTPLGHSNQEIEGLTLQNGTWEFETATCKIVAHPNADKEDTIHLIKTLKPIRQKILSRGIAGGKVTLEIGIPQPEPEHPRLADSIIPDNLIRFPIAEGTGRILAVCAEKGTAGTQEKISLQGIILHEIGHILEQYLSKEKGRLLRSLEKNIPTAGQALFEISPHYLSKQLGQLTQNFQTLQKMEKKGEKSLKTQGETWTLHQYRNKITEHFGSELFAEMVKSFYLEPILNDKTPKSEKTGWEDFDQLQYILTREARYTLKKGKADPELFPKKRKEPSILFWESLADLMP